LTVRLRDGRSPPGIISRNLRTRSRAGTAIVTHVLSLRSYAQLILLLSYIGGLQILN
jgi:hypothetical protein